MTELRLGDIVQITAPNDSDINEHIYHIVYIDEDKLRLEEADGHEETFTLTDGYWDNEAIENIRIKSRAEEVGYAKQNNLLKDVKRIFKFSARSELEDSFDIREYDNMFGKYVFKKAVPTWMPNGPSNLFITRLFSFCSSLVDNYCVVIQKNMLILGQIDTEHAHWVNIPKEHLVEFDRTHCWGWLAGNGKIEHY